MTRLRRSERQVLRNSLSATTVPLSTLIMSFTPVWYWKINESSGNVIDFSGNSRDLTPVGMTYRESALGDDSYGRFSASRATRTGYGAALSWGSTGLTVAGVRKRRESENPGDFLGVDNNDWYISITNFSGTGDRWTFNAGASNTNTVNVDGMNVDTPFLLVMTISSAGAVSVYRNNSLIGTASSNSPSATTTSVEYGFGRGPLVGQSYGLAGHWFSCKSVLDATQRTALYNSCVAKGLV